MDLTRADRSRVPLAQVITNPLDSFRNKMDKSHEHANVPLVFTPDTLRVTATLGGQEVQPSTFVGAKGHQRPAVFSSARAALRMLRRP
jgi:hypothetical protein